MKTDFRARINTLSSVRSVSNFGHSNSEKPDVTNDTPNIEKRRQSEASISLNRSLSLPDISKLESNEKCSESKVTSTNSFNDISNACSMECVSYNIAQSIDVNRHQEIDTFKDLSEDYIDFTQGNIYDFEKGSNDNSVLATSQQVENSELSVPQQENCKFNLA